MAQPPPAYTEKSTYPPPPPGDYPPPLQPGYPPPAAQGYPPQQPGYPPPQQPGYVPPPAPPGYQQTGGYPAPPPTSTVVVQPATVIGHTMHFGEFPQNVICPSCQANVVTAVDYVVGTLAWLIAGVLFLVGCWLCCFIPCFVDGCKDAVHRCPNCHKVVGVFRRM